MTAAPPIWKQTFTPVELARTFGELTAAWKEKAKYLSVTAQMALIPEYQRIIGMGAAALPLILEELRREPDHWIWALRAITGEDPVPEESRGKMNEVAAAWIAWGQQQGIIR